MLNVEDKDYYNNTYNESLGHHSYQEQYFGAHNLPSSSRKEARAPHTARGQPDKKKPKNKIGNVRGTDEMALKNLKKDNYFAQSQHSLRASADRSAGGAGPQHQKYENRQEMIEECKESASAVNTSIAMSDHIKNFEDFDKSELQSSRSMAQRSELNQLQMIKNMSSARSRAMK